MYIVIKEFVDLENNEHRYKAGDVFPFDNKKVSQERIINLATSLNNLGAPLITFIEDEVKKTTTRKSKPN